MKQLPLAVLIMALGIYTPAARSQNLPSQADKPVNVTKRMTATLEGKVIWEGEALANVNVSVYRDTALKELYMSGIPQREPGRFLLRVEPGRYYLVAYVDVNRSGRVDAGDGLGIYGITDWKNAAQKKQLIEIATGERISGLEIPITSRAAKVNGELKMVPISDYETSKFQQFRTELRKATSGCRGTLRLRKPLREGIQAFILAYTDATWKYQSGRIQVVASGEWTLNLPPGKYYLMAIVDNNGTNKLDAGDEIGFYGVNTPYKSSVRRETDNSSSTSRKPFLSSLRERPQPILIAQNRFIDDVEIAITAVYTPAPKRKNQGQISLTGTVSPLPAENTGTKVRIEAYSEPTLVTLLASAETDTNGTFQFALPPGTYYLVANVDADENGRYSKGDGIGGYGTVDMSTHPPTALVLTKNDIREGRTVEILISARYETDGQLRAALPGIETDIEQGGIAGRLLFDGKPVPRTQGIVSLSYTPDFQAPIAMPITVTDDGRYHVTVLPGRYFVMGVLDQNGDGTTSLKDNIGVYGTRFPVRGEPSAVTVFPGHTTPHVDIEMFATYIDKVGTMAEITDGGRWEIRRRYGEPDDIFSLNRNGQRTEEWMYWTKGVGFLWRATGAGWEFIDGKQFIPNAAAFTETATASQTEKSRTFSTSGDAPFHEFTTPGMGSPNDFLNREGILTYFDYDGILWSLSAKTGMVAVGAGTNPTVANDGTLLYEDMDGNLILHDSDLPTGEVLLDARYLAREAAISPDANYVAYIQALPTGRGQIVIRHLSSDDVFLVPSTALRRFTPAWNRDGSLLAYVTEGTIENPDAPTSRNIYAFDSLTKRIEPIVISAADDSEPSWSRGNPNQLAFTRTIDEHPSQIWLVKYSNTGEPTERQLTRYGGRHPVWVPPACRWILYENNGQLWRIDTENPDISEAPLMHNGQIVFGHEPAAVRP